MMYLLLCFTCFTDPSSPWKDKNAHPKIVYYSYMHFAWLRLCSFKPALGRFYLLWSHAAILNINSSFLTVFNNNITVIICQYNCNMKRKSLIKNVYVIWWKQSIVILHLVTLFNFWSISVLNTSIRPTVPKNFKHCLFHLYLCSVVFVCAIVVCLFLFYYWLFTCSQQFLNFIIMFYILICGIEIGNVKIQWYVKCWCCNNFIYYDGQV